MRRYEISEKPTVESKNYSIITTAERDGFHKKDPEKAMEG